MNLARAQEAAKRAIEQSFDGKCRIYELVCGKAGELAYAESWQQVGESPCHLELLQGAAVAETEAARPAARGRLFLPAALGPKLRPGSRVEVWQQGQRYQLGDSGVAACWATHCQVELRLLE